MVIHMNRPAKNRIGKASAFLASSGEHLMVILFASFRPVIVSLSLSKTDVQVTLLLLHVSLLIIEPYIMIDARRLF